MKKEPSVNERAFNCPHCEAYTTQFWNKIYVSRIKNERECPFFPEEDFEEKVEAVDNLPDEEKNNLIEYCGKMRLKLVFVSDEKNYIDNPALRSQ